MKKVIMLWALALAVTACSGEDVIDKKPGSDDDSGSLTAKERVDISLSRSERAIVDAQTEFAFNWFHAVDRDYRSGENWVVSPLSAALNLSMVVNGAGGSTRDELVAALMPGVVASVDQLNSLNRRLVDELKAVDNTVDMSVAGSMWFDNEVDVVDRFREVNLKYYDADATWLKLPSIDGWRRINDWVAENTGEMVNAPFSLDPVPDANVCLVSALHFKGRWTIPFDPSLTAKAPFVCADGSVSQVEMMSSPIAWVRVAVVDDCDVLRLLYGNAAFSLSVIMPRDNGSIDNVAASLDARRWIAVRDELRDRELDVMLPRFEVSGCVDLEKSLKALGVTALFDVSRVDMSGMTHMPLRKAAVVGQNVAVTVEETGTEGAGETHAVFDVLSPGDGPLSPSRFVVDRPFVFVIEEVSTGAVLFMGRVNRL